MKAKLKCYGMRECRQEIEVLHKAPKKTCSITILKRWMDCEGESSLFQSYTDDGDQDEDDGWSMVEFEERSDPCAHTSQPIEYKLTCHIRKKLQSLFF